MMKCGKPFLWIAAGLVLLASAAHAGGGNFAPAFGGRTLALNGLFIAGTDGLTLSINNPAGLVYLRGRGLEVSVIDRVGQFQFSSDTRGYFRSLRENDYSVGAGGYWSFSPSLAASLIYYRAADYQAEWPFAHFFRKEGASVVLGFDMSNRLQIDAIAPALAARFGSFSVGLSANAYRLRQEISLPISNAAWYSDQGLPAYALTYNQDAWSFAANVGVMAELSERTRFGAVIKSGYKATLSGDAASNFFAEVDSISSTSDLSSDFEMPWAIAAGVVHQLDDKITLNADVAYTLWGSTQESISFVFGNGQWQNWLAAIDTLTGVNSARLPLALDHALDAGVGIEYRTAGEMTYRAGYRYSQSPNASQTYSMLFPAVDQHWFSIGAGYQAESYLFNVGVAYAFGAKTTIVPSENAFLPGAYDSKNLVVAVNLRYTF